MIHIHSAVWGAMISAHINEEGYEITLPAWSGRQSDVSHIDALILFLQMVRGGATPMPDEPQPSPSLTQQAVEEVISEETNPTAWMDEIAPGSSPVDQEKLMAEFEAKQEADHAELVAQEEAGWTTPATDEELAGQSSDSRDLEDFFDEDDDEDDFYRWDDV